MDWAVTTTNLCKSYGSHDVLTNVNLQVPEGAVYGFVGANGAGKTTALRILLGLATATSGSATVLGVPRGSLPPKPVPGVSYLPDVPQITPWLGAKDALISLARLDGVEPDIAASRATDLLDVVGLKHPPGTVGAFSRGMKQRLGIAAALITAPQLLVLDEPTSAIDPIGRADVLAIIKHIAGQATVIFSTHILDDVQKVSTHIGVLHRGHLLAQGPLDDVLESTHHARAYFTLSARHEVSEKLADAVHSVDSDAVLEKQYPGIQQWFENLTTHADMDS
ncbi:ABC transporter ATP-binding protein [Corynebacterium sp. TAE3-ERU12]|uniref:ABC transporter ATP-binding protein n=1 Tax=Corynebacterium sp. TAE3-ERU12 TaxID=2849491 RepID=UPI001C486E0C|nr:ABC transporter ATP-binding protein [Corynebacterium sp. TAE3-ERU12]MBV7294958.1 ABC transporter ATP-binding protein [Corynebacterium sp. TAE3-ERU12]